MDSQLEGILEELIPQVEEALKLKLQEEHKAEIKAIHQHYQELTPYQNLHTIQQLRKQLVYLHHQRARWVEETECLKNCISQLSAELKRYQQKGQSFPSQRQSHQQLLNQTAFSNQSDISLLKPPCQEEQPCINKNAVALFQQQMSQSYLDKENSICNSNSIQMEFKTQNKSSSKKEQRLEQGNERYFKSILSPPKCEQSKNSSVFWDEEQKHELLKIIRQLPQF